MPPTVHLLEVGDLVEIANVDDGEILHTVCDAVKNLILSHTIRIPITAKANDDKALFFGHNGLVNMPSCDKMRQYYGAHFWCVCLCREIRWDCYFEVVPIRKWSRRFRKPANLEIRFGLASDHVIYIFPNRGDYPKFYPQLTSNLSNQDER